MADLFEYAYVIANDEMLDVIRQLRADASNAKTGLIDHIHGLQGSISFDDAGRPTFSLPDPLPRNWERWQGPVDNAAEPVIWSPEYMRIKDYWHKNDVAGAFDRACHQMAPAPHFKGLQFSFDEIGDKTVIICPPVSKDGDHALPQGCVQISCSDYIRMKEEAAPAKKQTVTAFKNKFSHG